MDPDACLAELLALTVGVDEDRPPGPAAAARMAELVRDLDGWLARGGFLPQRWTREVTP